MRVFIADDIQYMRDILKVTLELAGMQVTTPRMAWRR